MSTVEIDTGTRKQMDELLKFIRLAIEPMDDLHHGVFFLKFTKEFDKEMQKGLDALHAAGKGE